MDERKEIELIFKKFLDHTCSRQEFEILKQYLKEPEAALHIKRLMEEDGELIKEYRVLKEEPEGKDSLLFNKITQAVGNREVELLSKRKERRPKRHSRYLASLILIGGMVGSWFIYMIGSDGSQESWLQKKTLPGQKATITLTDGSTVLLNSDSELIYPNGFDDKREVILEGEAFFMIAKDEKRPFSIKSGKLITTVLGTSFNIKAFQNENIEVTVASGKVKVSPEENSGILSDDANQALILTPNQQAVYHFAGDYFGKEEVDASRYLAWREGIIKLDHLRFDEAAKVLERWYGVKIVLENDQIGNCVLIGGEFQNQSLHKILKTVELALGISYEFTRDGVIIRGKGCLSKHKKH